MLSEPVLVVARIALALDGMGIPYIVGGSLASSVYGIPRDQLDDKYLNQWAEILDVKDLLQRARQQR